MLLLLFRFNVHARSPACDLPRAVTAHRVLVIDDNATNRRILEEMLKNWRMNPATVDNGQSALDLMAQAKLAGAPFRLLLLD